MTASEVNRLESLLHEARVHNYSRRDLMRRAAVLGVAMPTAGVMLGSGVNAQDTDPSNIVLAMTIEPDTLENWRAYSTDGHPVLRNVMEALLNRDPETNELVGELATSWEQTDDVTWRFKLREGVTFHNGEAFNAEVAAFGINYTWSPENNFQIYQYVGPDMTATAVELTSTPLMSSPKRPTPFFPRGSTSRRFPACAKSRRSRTPCQTTRSVPARTFSVNGTGVSTFVLRRTPTGGATARMTHTAR